MPVRLKGSFIAGQCLGHVDVACPDAFVGVQNVKLGENAYRRIRIVGTDARELVPPGGVDASADVMRIRLKRGEVEPTTKFIFRIPAEGDTPLIAE